MRIVPSDSTIDQSAIAFSTSPTPNVLARAHRPSSESTRSRNSRSCSSSGRTSTAIARSVRPKHASRSRPTRSARSCHDARSSAGLLATLSARVDTATVSSSWWEMVRPRRSSSALRTSSISLRRREQPLGSNGLTPPSRHRCVPIEIPDGHLVRCRQRVDDLLLTWPIREHRDEPDRLLDGECEIEPDAGDGWFPALREVGEVVPPYPEVAVVITTRRQTSSRSVRRRPLPRCAQAADISSRDAEQVCPFGDGEFVVGRPR